MNKRILSFKWWWDKKEEETEVAEPYEFFRIVLFGRVAGDIVDNPEDIVRILTEAGYEIKRKIPVLK